MSDDEGTVKEDDFDRFMKGEADTVKPIDHDPSLDEPAPADRPAPAAPAPMPPPDVFLEKVGDYKAPKAPAKERASSEENLDPVKQQHARELKAEQARKEKLRARDIPEHMMEHVNEDIAMNLIGKGETLDLIQKVPSLRKLYIGAGWTPKALDQEIDIDLSIFLLNKNDTTTHDTDVVFYNQLTAYDGAIKHEGDNRTGAGEGDEEGIFIDLNGLPFEIVKIMVILSVYDELEVGFHMGQVRNTYVRLANREYNEEICRFQLAEEYDGNTAVYVMGIVREGPRWVLETLGTGIGRGGLQNIATRYGIIVKELQSTG